MMKIYTKLRPKHSGQTFVEIVKHSPCNSIGTSFLLYDTFTPDDIVPHTKAKIVDINTIEFSDLTSFYTMLDMDCDVQMYFEIKQALEDKRKPSTVFRDNELIDIILFTSIVNLNPIKYYAPND